MNHQPFDNWLLSEEQLSNEDELMLREHLSECNQCRELDEAWQDVANLFTEAEEIEPAPGFVNRWQATLDADQVAVKAMRHRWQSWIVLVLIANGAILVTYLMGVQIFNTYGSFSDWLLSGFYKAATAMMLANGFQNVFSTLFRTFTQIIPMGWWVGITLTLCVSTLLWIFSMSKLTSLPRRTS